MSRVGKRLLLLHRRRGGGLVWPGMGSSLAALYLFDDGAGTTLTDTSGNGLNGTLGATTAAPSWVTEGLSFDGGDYVTLPGGGALDLSGNNATFAIVFNSTSTQTILLGAYQTEGSFYGYTLSLNGGGTGTGNFNLYTNAGGWDRPANTNLSGAWYCMIIVTSGGTTTWNLNGNSYGSPVAGASITSQTGVKYIGCNRSPALVYPLTGSIGALGVWSTPLGAADLATVYANLQAVMAPRGVALPDPT